MKKTYSSPETKAVRVALQSIIAGTTQLPGQPSGQSFSVSFSDDDFEGEAASRRGSSWGDED